MIDRAPAHAQHQRAVTPHQRREGSLLSSGRIALQQHRIRQVIDAHGGHGISFIHANVSYLVIIRPTIYPVPAAAIPFALFLMLSWCRLAARSSSALPIGARRSIEWGRPYYADAED
jgi:hypothetical protein